MAEIKTSNSAGKRSRARSAFPEEGGRSALSRIGGRAPGAGESALSTLDAEQRINRAPAPSAGREADSNEETTGGSAGPGGLSISFGAGAIVMNDASRSPEEMAREIVKPLSRELKKLGYLSS